MRCYSKSKMSGLLLSRRIQKIILFGINFAVLIAEEFLVLNYVLRIDCGNEQFALTCLSYFDRYLLRTVPVRQLASCSNSNLLI